MQQAPIHFGFSAIQGQWYLDLHRAATGFSPIFTDLMGAAETGQWIQWVLRTKWSSAADGAVQLWKNGVLVADHTNLVTWNIPNVAVYPEMGIYRSSGPTPGSYFSTTGTVYFDSARIGTTREIVDPANY